MREKRKGLPFPNDTACNGCKVRWRGILIWIYAILNAWYEGVRGLVGVLNKFALAYTTAIFSLLSRRQGGSKCSYQRAFDAFTGRRGMGEEGDERMKGGNTPMALLLSNSHDGLDPFSVGRYLCLKGFVLFVFALGNGEWGKTGRVMEIGEGEGCNTPMVLTLSNSHYGLDPLIIGRYLCLKGLVFLRFVLGDGEWGWGRMGEGDRR